MKNRNKINLKYYNLIELIVLFFGIINSRFLQILKYKEKYLPIKNEIQSLLELNLILKRKNDTLEVKYLNNSKLNTFCLRLSTSDSLVFKQVFIDNEYMPIIKLVQKNNIQDSIKLIVDAGSNIGLASIYFNNFYPESRIISIEPESSNFQQLLLNIKQNDLYSRIEPVNKALWINNTDILEIGTDFRDRKHWSKYVKKSTLKDQNAIQAITIQEILEKYSSTQIIDIFKIDIEGTEVELFNSEEFTLNIKSIRFFCIEVHEEFKIKNKIQITLQENGFEIEEIGQTVFAYNKYLK